MVSKPGQDIQIYPAWANLKQKPRQTILDQESHFCLGIWAASQLSWRSSKGILMHSITGTAQEARMSWALGYPVPSVWPEPHWAELNEDHRQPGHACADIMHVNRQSPGAGTFITALIHTLLLLHPLTRVICECVASVKWLIQEQPWRNTWRRH